jgi:hypothetical protein
MDDAALPFVDDHAVTVGAPAAVVWVELVETLDRSFSGLVTGWYVRAVGGLDRDASGPRPLTTGSTFPGFHVVRSVPGRELALEGRHRFSTYALTFRLDPAGPDRTRLRAESRATFPGVLGATYRALVLGTHGHVVLMRRMLGSIRDRAEGRGRAAA